MNDLYFIKLQKHEDGSWRAYLNESVVSDYCGTPTGAVDSLNWRLYNYDFENDCVMREEPTPKTYRSIIQPPLPRGWVSCESQPPVSEETLTYTSPTRQVSQYEQAMQDFATVQRSMNANRGLATGAINLQDLF